MLHVPEETKREEKINPSSVICETNMDIRAMHVKK